MLQSQPSTKICRSTKGQEWHRLAFYHPTGVTRPAPGDGNSSRSEAAKRSCSASDQTVKCAMSRRPGRGFFAVKAVKSAGITSGATVALVWNAKFETQASSQTATLTALSSNLSPHEAIGNAKSQSPLCCEAARKDARWCAETRLTLYTENYCKFVTLSAIMFPVMPECISKYR